MQALDEFDEFNPRGVPTWQIQVLQSCSIDVHVFFAIPLQCFQDKELKTQWDLPRV